MIQPKKPIKELLGDLLMPLLGSQELIDMWWTGQNRAFDFKTPNEMFEIDQHKVIDYVKAQYR